MPQSDLIFDVGMHIGIDTRYYLNLGYRVVAVEANPELAEAARTTFAKEIDAGLLIIENIGLGEKRGILPFYVNHGTAEWSSFKQNLGTRNGRFHVIDVPCFTLSDLIAKHGAPHFLKVDIEGLDNAVVSQVRDLSEKPNLVSLEDGGIQSMLAMCHAGVKRFKFSNQPDMQRVMNRTTGKPFGESSSGLFGDDLPGEWLDIHSAFDFYVKRVRPPNSQPIDGWWDIHGAMKP